MVRGGSLEVPKPEIPLEHPLSGTGNRIPPGGGTDGRGNGRKNIFLSVVPHWLKAEV